MEIAVVYLVISYCALCWGQTPYVFNPTKIRTSPAPVTLPTGKVWDGVGSKPKIPGVKDAFDSVPIIMSHGASCNMYPNMERGEYIQFDDKTIHYYYPWTHYVLNCDVTRFLHCEEKSKTCKCFPGYYWNGATADAKDGRCVAGYLQNCDTFKAYDFRINPLCGEGMECEPNNATGIGKWCLCSKTQVGRAYVGPESDNFGNDKYYCPLNKMMPVMAKGTCSEFRGKTWVVNDPAAAIGKGRYKVELLTKTGCGDVGGEKNVICRFPPSQTGPNPVDDKGNKVSYGQRKGGTCVCTDDKLTYSAGRGGCFPRNRAKCKDGIVSFMGRKPGDKNRTIMTDSCGPMSMCIESTGRCSCKMDASGRQFTTVNGQCTDGTVPPVPGGGVGDIDVGVGQLVGNKCSKSTPCHLRGGQRCSTNGTCECQKGYLDGEDNKCKGLYGVPCGDVMDCVKDGGFDCVKVPELKTVKPNIPDQKYCVCKQFDLNTQSGRCGAVSLTPTELGILILVAILLHRVPKISN